MTEKIEACRAEDLRQWGYAPGNYMFLCRDCPPNQPRVGNKRSIRCEYHARAARDASPTTDALPAGEAAAWEDVEDWFADCIAATLDVDWGPRDAARYLVACMKAGEFPVQFFPPEPPKPLVAECPASFDGLHHVDSTMESGPYNCFHCERTMR